MRTLILFSLAACKPPGAAPDQPPTVLSIVAVNDFHGALYEMPIPGDKTSGQVVGGLPWLHAAVEHLRAEHPNLLLLDGGDEFQGTWPVNQTQGRGSVLAMNLIGLDATAVGNHEFDYGALKSGEGHPLRGALEAGAKLASYPMLTSNVFDEHTGEAWSPEGVAPWTLIEQQGLKIAVVGLSTIDTPTTTIAAHVAGLDFRDGVASIQAVWPEIQAVEPDVTVLVAHLTGQCAPAGYLQAPPADCTPDGEVGALLAGLPAGTFDVMVLGHAHTLLQQRIGDTFVIESRARGHILSQLDLVVGPDGVDPEASVLKPFWPLVHAPVDPGCGEGTFPMEPLEVGGVMLSPSQEALELIEGLEAEAGSLCTELACADHTLGRSGAGETELGDWMADAELAVFPEADLAIQNSGGVRADLREGTVRRGDLQAVMPFDNRSLLVEMTGAQVELLFRLGSSGRHGLLQVAGATYAFDPAKEGGSDLNGDGEVESWETDRLCEVTVAGEPLDPERVYKVVTSDFLFGGGDHLGPAFEGTRVLREGPLLRDSLYTHAEAQEACIGAEGDLVDPQAPRVRVGPCDGSGHGAVD